ncbi:MAG TPA: NAD-dependent epimerase/dehydratase family protein [Nevskiaceae bacterium]|nr:NAD-dependent epimerase/dehydratase family protein [Nevskiaceae bacterium]
MSKRVLLTGAGGFVGCHTLMHFLQHTDWDIVATDSFRHCGTTDRITQQLDMCEFKNTQRLTVLTHDLRVPFSKRFIHQMGKIDYIVSMASESSVDQSIVEPREFIENNIELILTLLEYAREHGVEKFLQVSTDEVYGPAAYGHAYQEGDARRPSNPYSASKSAQEDICYSYWRTYGVPMVITNTMNIIGELQDPEKYVPKIIRSVMHGDTVSVHASADGKLGSRHYLHARNQADALLFILQHVAALRYAPGHDIARFHVAGDEELDNLQLAQLIAHHANRPLKYELIDFHSARPGHDLRYALDGSKLTAAGWQPPVPLKESLRRTVEWSVAHPEWLL